MSGNRWDQPGVPHKGWHCVDVVDLRADVESADETDYATCQMCGNEKVRYVHVMEHPDLAAGGSLIVVNVFIHVRPPLEVHPIHSSYCARLHPICAARPASAGR